MGTLRVNQLRLQVELRVGRNGHRCELILGVDGLVDGISEMGIPSLRPVEDHIGNGFHSGLAFAACFPPNAESETVEVVLIVAHPEEY